MKAFCGDCRVYHPFPLVSGCPISLGSGWLYGQVTFDRDSTSMDEAVAQMSEFRRLWMQVEGRYLRALVHSYYGRTFTTAHDLYDLCIDRSRNESSDSPFIVTSFNMMDNEDWAL